MKNGYSTMSVLLLMIVLVSSVLGVLGAATAASDYRRALKQADYAERLQQCTNEAQLWLHDTAQKGEEGRMSQTFSDGEGHSIFVTAEFQDGSFKVITFNCDTLWSDDKAIGNLIEIN